MKKFLRLQLVLFVLASLLAACSPGRLSKPQIDTRSIDAKTVEIRSGDWLHDPAKSGDEIIWGITPGPDGAMWFATNNGIWRFGGGAWREYQARDGLPANSVTAIAVSPDQILYAAACQGGLVRLNGERWVTVGGGMPEPLQTHCAWALLPEENGRVWLGVMNPRSGQAPGYGAVLYDGSAWKTYMPEKTDLGTALPVARADLGGQDVFKALPGADGSLWFLSEGALARFDGKRWSKFSNADLGSEKRFFNLITVSDGSLWLGSETGALRYDGKSWSLFPEQNLAPIAAASDGAVWFATETALLRYQDGGWSRYPQPEDFDKARILSAAVGSDGALWIGTIQSGIYRYLPGGGTIPQR